MTSLEGIWLLKIFAKIISQVESHASTSLVFEIVLHLISTFYFYFFGNLSAEDINYRTILFFFTKELHTVACII